jgi:hypothetical protein
MLMATKVRFAIPEREIGNNGLTFHRRTTNGDHGSITVRKNNLDWRPSGNTYAFRVTWEEFAQFAMKRDKRLKPKKTPVRANTQLAAA